MPKVRRSSSLSFDRSRASPYPCTSEDAEHYKLNSPLESTENFKEWEDTRCPICMEHPHNAVLIKCSSHEKGCRPFMCNTSYRHSNCLDQFCKSSVPDTIPMTLQELPLAHTASHSSREEESLPGQTSPWGSQLQLHPACPLCRGRIYGYIVVRAARHFMNCKLRSCSSETCDFTGTYSELRKHARSEHPYVRPSEVDPNRHREWMRLERQRDLEDVLSMVRVGSEDDIIPDSSTDSGWMTSLLNAMFHSFEIMIVSHLMESSSDIEQTHSRRSGRTTRVQQDNNIVSATRSNNTVSGSRSRRSGLLYRATSNNVETSRAPRQSNNSVSGSHLMESSSDIEQTRSRRSGRTTRVQQDNNMVSATRSNNTVSGSRSRRSGLLYRATSNNVETSRAPRQSNNSVSGGTSHAPRWSNNLSSREIDHAAPRQSNNVLSRQAGHAPSRWSNNSLMEASSPRRGNSSEVGTNRVLRRGNTSVLGNNSVIEENSHRGGSNSVSQESNHVHGQGNNSLSEEDWHLPRWVRRRGNTTLLGNNSVPVESSHRWGRNSVSQESNSVHGWGNNSLSEEDWHLPRWGNTFPRWGNNSVPESTPRRPRRLRFRSQMGPTNNNRR